MKENLKLYLSMIMAKIIKFVGLMIAIIGAVAVFYSFILSIILIIIGIGLILYGKYKMFDFERNSGFRIYSR